VVAPPKGACNTCCHEIQLLFVQTFAPHSAQKSLLLAACGAQPDDGLIGLGVAGAAIALGLALAGGDIRHWQWGAGFVGATHDAAFKPADPGT
jgi:hypothetical protein